MIFHDYADVGIAVSSPKGLMVPVVRNAEQMSLAEIEQKFKNNFVDVMISVSFASKLSITNFLEKIQNTGYRKIEFFTYVDNKPEESTAQVEFDIQDNFNINDIFAHYLKTQSYTELVKESLTDKFLTTLQKVRELDKYA
jgi:pyruvate/2-oxoglutarate dehydrogenase complex dihydrolipoamide acyltransferase (E2) component